MMHGNVVLVTLFRLIVQVSPQDLLLGLLLRWLLLLRLRLLRRRFRLLELGQVKFVGFTHFE